MRTALFDGKCACDGMICNLVDYLVDVFCNLQIKRNFHKKESRYEWRQFRGLHIL